MKKQEKLLHTEIENGFDQIAVTSSDVISVFRGLPPIIALWFTCVMLNKTSSISVYCYYCNFVVAVVMFSHTMLMLFAGVVKEEMFAS